MLGNESQSELRTPGRLFQWSSNSWCRLALLRAKHSAKRFLGVHSVLRARLHKVAPEGLLRPLSNRSRIIQYLADGRPTDPSFLASLCFHDDWHGLGVEK